MTTDTAVSTFAPLLAAEPDPLLFWLDPEESAALAAAIAGWAPSLPLNDIEAMILSGDDGATPYWFAPPGDAPAASAREAVPGAGDDIIEGAGQSLYTGGTGNDTLTVWGADFTLAFNAGDGFDTVVWCARGAATISLGLGIGAPDVFFTRSGGDLIVNTGAAEGMALTGWYDKPAPGALGLQLIGAAGIELYDLMALTAAFGDQQGAPLRQGGTQGDAPAGGELAALYATGAAGIEISGASAALWTQAFGFIAGLGLLL